MRLGFLQRVYEHRGPFATVLLDTSADAEDAAKAIELRWRSARNALRDSGADEHIVRAVEDAVGRHRSQAADRGQVIVATPEGVVFTDELPHRPGELADDEWVYVGPVPHLLPYLRRRGARIPYVLAVVDHEGADVATVNAARHEADTEVAGDYRAVHKAHAAGHEKRQQHAVEEQWKHNAAEAAQEIGNRAVTIGAEAIVLAGDVQQRKLVREQIRKGLQELVVDTDASHRDRKASDESLQREVAETIEAVLDARIADTVHEFERQRGESARAVEGWDATVAALQREQADTVLRAVPDDGAPAELAIGPSSSHVAVDGRQLVDLGATDIRRAPADAAVLRALAGADSNLVLVDPDRVALAGGIGAVLRYTDG